VNEIGKGEGEERFWTGLSVVIEVFSIELNIITLNNTLNPSGYYLLTEAGKTDNLLSVNPPMTERCLASPTVKFVDEYCQSYQQLFPEVRSFEAFKNLHLVMISEIKRKSLLEIPK